MRRRGCHGCDRPDTRAGRVHWPVAAVFGAAAMVIALQSMAGFAGHLATGGVGWALAAGVTAMAVLGSFVGARLASRIDAAVLRTLFGWFVLLMAGALVAQHGAPIAGAVVVGVTVLAFGCRYAERCPWALIPPRVTLT